MVGTILTTDEAAWLSETLDDMPYTGGRNSMPSPEVNYHLAVFVGDDNEPVFQTNYASSEALLEEVYKAELAVERREKELEAEADAQECD